MLHTPLNHQHPVAVAHNPHGHTSAQHSHVQTPSTRCTPHAVHAVHTSLPAHTHELNFSDWLHMSPAQVAMMSPVPAAPYTPPAHNHHSLFVPTPSPLQYTAVVNAQRAVASPNARNDFLATSPLSYSSPPFQVHASYQHPSPYHFQQMHSAQVPNIVDNMHHLHDATHTAMGPSPLSTEYFPFANNSAANTSASMSPISHQGSPYPFQGYARPSGDGESTPVTTLSAVDESQARSASQENSRFQPFLDKLRGASPVTDAGTNPSSGSPERPAPSRAKPIESTESPFRIAAPQPRQGSGPFSPLPPSSRPTSALGALSELAELASRHSTPSQSQQQQQQQQQHPLAAANHSALASPAPHSHPSSRAVSRPASALSTRSTASHAKAPKIRRKQLPPRRFAPSLLSVQLPYTQTAGGGEGGKPITPSLIDGLPRGPLEFEDEGHRYRTRSKLRSLKAEIQEREREADLLLIRRGLRGEGADAEDKSGLEMLASVSVTRRIDLDSESGLGSGALARRSETPLSVYSQKNAARPKRAPKRAFRDLEDADCESATTASDAGSRTPSKRPRVPTEKATTANGNGKANGKANVKKEQTETRALRSRVTRTASSAVPRPSAARASSQRNAKKASTPNKNGKASTPSASIAKKGSAAKQKEDIDVQMDDLAESELSSLSSMSETEDGDGGKSSAEDTDYSPKVQKSKAGARSSSAKSSAPLHSTKPSPSKSSSKSKSSSSTSTLTCMPIDTARGASGIPTPIRTFPADVPIHAAFPLLYRKFPVPAYTDPDFLNFEPVPFGSGSGSGSPGTVSVTASSALGTDESRNEGEDRGDTEPPVPAPPSSGHFNAPRSAEDLYTPRFVRGVGRDKMGLCPICYESPERGGAGRAEWLSMKFSAFNYHMQYAHGISPVTAAPFSPPVAFRIVARTPNHKNEKSEMLEGKCHRCQEWAPVEGVKCVEAKLKEIYWWKHAAQCHKGSTIPGERDVHLEDAVATRVRRLFDVIHARQHPTVPVLPDFGGAAAAAAHKELFTTTPRA